MTIKEWKELLSKFPDDYELHLWASIDNTSPYHLAMENQGRDIQKDNGLHRVDMFFANLDSIAE